MSPDVCKSAEVLDVDLQSSTYVNIPRLTRSKSDMSVDLEIHTSICSPVSVDFSPVL